MNQNVLTLQPGGQPLAYSLGFGARSVLVNNYTSSYVRLPDAGIDLPPWTYGAVVSFPIPVSTARARLIATAPAVAGPAVPVGQATLAWTDEALPSGPGHLLQQSQYAQQIVLGSVLATTNSTASQDFQIPAGVVSIGYGIDNSGGIVFSPASVKIVGDQTQTTYRNDPNPTSSPIHASLLMATDTSITVSVTAQAGGSAKVQVLAWTVPVTETVSPDLATPVPVTFSNNAAGFTSTAAPWQAAQNLSTIGVNPVAGASSTLIAATSGTIYIHYISFIHIVTSAAFGDFESSDGAVKFLAWNQAVANPPPFDGKGAALPAGTGLVVKNNSGVNAQFLNGGISWSRQ